MGLGLMTAAGGLGSRRGRSRPGMARPSVRLPLVGRPVEEVPNRLLDPPESGCYPPLANEVPGPSGRCSVEVASARALLRSLLPAAPAPAAPVKAALLRSPSTAR
jgi:hypothetical protein